MNKPIQPGELCVVVGGRTQELIGKFVIAERPRGDREYLIGEFWYELHGPGWICRSAAVGGKLPAAGEGSLDWVLSRPIRTIYLKPIRGDEQPSEATTTNRELETQ